MYDAPLSASFSCCSQPPLLSPSVSQCLSFIDRPHHHHHHLQTLSFFISPLSSIPPTPTPALCEIASLYFCCRRDDGWQDGRQGNRVRERCSFGLVYLINYVLLLLLATLHLIFVRPKTRAHTYTHTHTDKCSMFHLSSFSSLPIIVAPNYHTSDKIRSIISQPDITFKCKAIIACLQLSVIFGADFGSTKTFILGFAFTQSLEHTHLNSLPSVSN